MKMRSTRLAVCSVAALTTAMLVAAPAASASTQRSPAEFTNGTGAGKVEMAFFEQWGIYGRGFDLANADNEGEIADLSDLDYAFGGVEPQSGATQNPAGALANPVAPVQENPTLPNYNPVVCTSLDVWADYQTPGLTPITGANGQAEPNTGTNGLRGNFQQLSELKAKYPNLKVIMSLGGYNGSAFFSQAASTPSARQAFVSSCINMFIKGDPGVVGGYNSDEGFPATSSTQTSLLPDGTTAGLFDGFDIDWEYPGNNNGAPGNQYSSSPQDTENLVLLMREFRTQLDALSRTTGKQYTLSAELPAGLQNAVDEDPAGIARYANYDVIMDYDFQGPWNGRGPDQLRLQPVRVPQSARHYSRTLNKRFQHGAVLRRSRRASPPAGRRPALLRARLDWRSGRFGLRPLPTRLWSSHVTRYDPARGLPGRSGRL